MKTISLADIQVDLSSYVDPNGFVFHYQDKIYRAIKSPQESFYRSLFEKGVVQNLEQNYHLVASHIIEASIPEADCPLVIEHAKIFPLTYCVEWPPSMLKKAALATLELNRALLDEDCMLQDAYPWNILFRGTNPMFVDFTSIRPIQPNLIWPAYQQFINFFQNPLKLATMRKGKIARHLLFDYIQGVTLEDVVANYSGGYSIRHPWEVLFSKFCLYLTHKVQSRHQWKMQFQQIIKQQGQKHINKNLRVKFIENVIRKIERVRIREERSSWKDYYEQIDQDFHPKKKEEVVHGLLQKLKPKTVLDLGSNVGKFSIIAAKTGAQVISLDSSEHCMEQLFQVSEKEGYTITPLVGNVLNTTPSFGFLTRQFPSMLKRLQSDVVLCLGLMHHLHINGRQSFDRIASLLDEVANQAIIFEYVDLQDDNIHLLDHGREIQYSLESVSDALSQYFQLSYFESDRKTRKIILCQR